MTANVNALDLAKGSKELLNLALSDANGKTTHKDGSTINVVSIEIGIAPGDFLAFVVETTTKIVVGQLVERLESVDIRVSVFL